jgi:predicted N-acyltransferase
MSGANSPLSFSVVNSLKEIPADKWDKLFGENNPESYGYQKTLEEADIREFSFNYLLAKRGDSLTAIIPLFIMDFSLDTLVGPPLQKLAAKFKRLFTFRVLFAGSPTTEEFYLGFSPQEDAKMLLDEALRNLSLFCRQNKIQALVFHNLSEKNKPLAEYLLSKGFFAMETLPTTLLEIKTSSLEDYMSCLSHNMRKDLRKKLRKSSESIRLRTEMRDDIDDVAEEVYKLYLNNFNNGDVRFETLTPAFFRNICRNLPGKAKFFLTYNEDKMVAFNLCLTQGDLFIDKFIGFDPAVARDYHLYFTTFCHNLDWCIKNRIRFYQPGTTDYGPKVRLGAKLIPLYVYTKALNPLLHTCLKLLAPLIQPKNIDPTLKKLKINKAP